MGQKNNILILGDGLLSNSLRELKNIPYISRKKDNIDIRNVESYINYLDGIDIVINCIANTDTYSLNKELHWDINYKAVADLVDICNEKNIKLIHISTDYIYANSNEDAKETDIPVHHKSWYGYTKLIGDAYIELKSNNYLIIRTGHKPYPFPYENATISVIGNFDYVHNNAKLILKLIKNECTGIFNIGSEKKTIYQLAIKSVPDIKPVIGLPKKEMPNDISMDLTKLKTHLNYGKKDK